ncbi:DNA mismatch repair protein C-terminal [Penicillium paradoxum]|uniref:DNA mismatch repair protein C-terminal n=1 Tax=Penicillium paradoxum TaxID=176176 RepID=UPI002549704A|nr:DNA mismatch repair protein C-terminal [Penicillium paradoxum]KAJ5781207.1 DNA mismatch repair protein C-terminal [Penicillium paradoxum]
MPIEALPESTSRAIGSTSAISDPYSVVKELVDNALDASATSLQIEISQNTVDVIQLKDNGHGISPEDQQHVCKRAFTSKIQTLDDLKNVGGSTLGFRGEALASVAEMSRILAVTTRVESEIAGVCLKYGRNGELTGTQRTSHPVGTTVRITDFLKHIPVRRQTALKGATRTLTRIKKLLQAYAIAQPSKRLSLKVLKAKNENSNWTYAPSSNPSLSDAALKVAGAETSSSCILKQSLPQKIDNAGNLQDSSDQKEYQAIAFLPRTEFDVSKIINAGQYISVDGRPLSSNRGIGHDIIKVFKTYIRGAASKGESSRSVNDPFLCLQIRCPQGTYDVNIEPAKDDLLFEDRGLVLALVENLLRDHYGAQEKTERSGPKGVQENTFKSKKAVPGFELLMADKSTVRLATDPQDSENPFKDATPYTPLSHRPLQGKSLFLPVDHSGNDLESPDESSTARTKRSSFANPWSISKTNASFQTPQRKRNSVNATSPTALSSGSLQGLIRRESESRSLQHSPNISDLTSPPTSRLASGSPVRNRRQQPRTSAESSPESNRISSARRAERERDRDRYGNGALDTWFQRTTQVSLQQIPVEGAATQDLNESSLSVLAQKRFGSSAKSSSANAHIDRQNDGCSDRVSQDDVPLQSSDNLPISDEQEGYIPRSMDSGRGFPVLERWAAQLHEDGDHEEPSDLERALDFERRKKEAIQNHRIRFKNHEKPSGPQPSSVSHSPHRSRYLAAKAALTSSQTSIREPTSTTALSSHDPRAYLIGQTRDHSVGESSAIGEKARKPPTHRLPFERIPDGSKLHDLAITCSVDLASNSDLFKLDIPGDLPVTSDNQVTAFSTSNVKTCLPFWNERLMLIMEQHYKSHEISKPMSISIDLEANISRHLKDLDANEN